MRQGHSQSWQSGLRGQWGWIAELCAHAARDGHSQAGTATLAKNNSDGAGSNSGATLSSAVLLPTHAEISAPTKQAVTEGISTTNFSHW